jgi:hypothetical protein
MNTFKIKQPIDSYMIIKTDNKLKHSLLFISITIVFSFLLMTCKKDVPSPAPVILVSNSTNTIVEDDPVASVSLLIIRTGPSGKEVSIDFKTVDSTAIAGKDYEAVTSGKLIFKAGETSKEISINILQDTAKKTDTYFSVVLTNPVNAVLGSA